MKKFFMCILLCSALLTGCGDTVESVGDVEDKTSMFVRIEGGGVNIWAVVYHKETKVMYAVSTGGYNAGTFTLLVNPDGTPMIWEG